MASKYSLDTSDFTRFLTKLESLGGDVENTVTEVLTKYATQVNEETDAAMTPSAMPAQGRYWTGTTKASVIHGAQVTWEGLSAVAPIGFDFSKRGAGGYLISGTPKMQPVAQLNKMFRQKTYLNMLKMQMANEVLDRIFNLSAGG